MHMTLTGTIRLPLSPDAARSFRTGVKQHLTGNLVVGGEECGGNFSAVTHDPSSLA